MGTIAFISLLVLSFVLFGLVRKGLINDQTLQTLANIAAIVALIAAALVFIVPAADSINTSQNTPVPTVIIDPRPSYEPPVTVDPNLLSESTPLASPTPLSESTPLANPTPLKVDEPIYFNSLETQTDISWRVWGDSDGRAGYENRGYYVLSFDSKAGWLSANLDDEYKNFILSIDATPISYGLITGYSIAVGWEESNSYYSFEVRPDGECGLIRVNNYRRASLLTSQCPQPVQNEPARIRLELDSQRMRAFINDEYITTMYLSNYEGGKIGLGTHNGGQLGSGAEAKVKFNNLVIWNVPMGSSPPSHWDN